MSVSSLPPRGGMSKAEYRAMLAEKYQIFPNSREYFLLSGEFYPLEMELGVEVETGRKVIWNPADQLNQHVEVVGATGSGKTNFLRLIASEATHSAIPVLVIDVHGDLDVKHIRTAEISSGLRSTIGINPLSMEGLDPNTHTPRNLRIELTSALRQAVPSLRQKQMYILTEAIRTACVEVGIEDRDPQTWHRPPPTFANVKRILDHWVYDPEMRGQRESILGCADALGLIFGDEVFQRQNVLTAAQLSTESWRLALNHLPEYTKVIVVDTVLRAVLRRLRAMGPMPTGRTGQPRMFVVIDEAKVIANGHGDPHKGSRILNVIATEGRKFGLGLIVASQSREHFGNDVLRSSGTRLALRALDSRDAQENAKGMQISASDLLSLRGNGDGYLQFGPHGRAVRIQVKPAGN